MDNKHYSLIHNDWFQVGLFTATTKVLNMISATNKTLCFIKAIAIKRKFPAIVMSSKEYFENYVAKFLGKNKPLKVNILRKAQHTLMESYSGFALKRFEFYEEDIQRAIEAVTASGIPNLFLAKPLYADQLNLNPNSKGLF